MLSADRSHAHRRPALAAATVAEEPTMTTAIRLALITSSFAVVGACGGVTLGGHTLVAPLERPAVAGVRTSADAGDADDGLAPDRSDVVTADGTFTAGVDETGSPIARTRLSASPRVLAARAATGCFVADGRPFDRATPSDGPIDPWRAVDGNRPRVLPHTTAPYLAADGATCDAAHDHCLLDCAWIVTTDLRPRSRAASAVERIATDAGFDGLADDEPFVAYRSLPVTRRNLDVGALVLVSEDVPHGGSEWQIGEAEAIDWAEGTIHLHGQRHAFDLAFTRVAVLAYERGGAVQAANPLDDDRLAIRPGELILPR